MFALYVLFGYPLLLELLARFGSRPVRENDEPKTVTVVLAVHNGEAWLRAKLVSILRLRYPRRLMQVMVVSDGSSDGTERIAGEFASDVELVRVERGGKMAALNAGIARARGDILFFTDVRQPLHPDCLRNLVACLGDPEVGGACGQIVFMDGAGDSPHAGLYWRYEKWIRRNLSRTGSILAGTGYIYAMRRELAAPLPTNMLVDDLYLPLAIVLRGYRFVFDERAVAYEYATSLETEFRRKVRTLAGIYQVAGHFPALLNPFRGISVHFLSYKAGRVLLPYAMAAAAASGFWLPGGWAWPAVAAQALFYGLAAVDPWIAAGWRLKRLSAPAHTFVVMLGASVCAASIFFVPAERLWKKPTVVQPAARAAHR